MTDVDAIVGRMLDAALEADDAPDFNALFVLADYLEEREHPGADALRWAASKRKRPLPVSQAYGGDPGWYFTDERDETFSNPENNLPLRFIGVGDVVWKFSNSDRACWLWLINNCKESKENAECTSTSATNSLTN